MLYSDNKGQLFVNEAVLSLSECCGSSITRPILVTRKIKQSVVGSLRLFDFQVENVRQVAVFSGPSGPSSSDVISKLSAGSMLQNNPEILYMYR